MNAEILCIGTELLIGQTLNTNATYLARELAALGIDLHWVSTLGDNLERMGQALSQAASRSDLVIVTGGLGPTADDLTREALALLAGEPLEERLAAREHLEALFSRRNRPFSPSNLRQALMPQSAELIPNEAGTACGLALKVGSAWVLAFPGVPWELKAMWQAWASPRLALKTRGAIRSALLKYVGIGEAALAERVAGLLAGTNPTVAPYAGDGEVHLRVTAKADTEQAANAMLAPLIAELSAITPYFYGRDEDSLPAVVLELLKERNETLALAESCTGGQLADRLTNVPGSSEAFLGALISYAPRLKHEQLGLPAELLETAIVSQAAAEQMALGIRDYLKADWGIGITGYAGPQQTDPPGDVGLVWIALAGKSSLESQCARYGESSPRPIIKQRATQSALDMLRLKLSADIPGGGPAPHGTLQQT